MVSRLGKWSVRLGGTSDAWKRSGLDNHRSTTMEFWGRFSASLDKLRKSQSLLFPLCFNQLMYKRIYHLVQLKMVDSISFLWVWVFWLLMYEETSSVICRVSRMHLSALLYFFHPQVTEPHSYSHTLCINEWAIQESCHIISYSLFYSVRIKITLSTSEDQTSPSLNLDARARDETDFWQVVVQHHPQRLFGHFNMDDFSWIRCYSTIHWK